MFLIHRSGVYHEQLFSNSAHEFILFSVTLCTADRHYRYSTPVDTDGVFWLHWDVDYVTSTVHFRLRAHLAASYGWFGLGFSDYGEITNADLAVFWTDEDGWHHFQVIYWTVSY